MKILKKRFVNWLLKMKRYKIKYRNISIKQITLKIKKKNLNQNGKRKIYKNKKKREKIIL